MFSSDIAAIGIPDALENTGMALVNIAAGEGNTPFSAEAKIVTTLRAPLPKNHNKGARYPIQTTEMMRRMRMEINFDTFDSCLGFTKFSPTGRVEDITLFWQVYNLAQRLKLDKITDVPLHLITFSFGQNRWFPMYDKERQSVIGCQFSQTKKRNDTTRILEKKLLLSVSDSTQNPNVTHHEYTQNVKQHLLTNFIPLPDIARIGVLLYFIPNEHQQMSDPPNILTEDLMKLHGNISENAMLMRAEDFRRGKIGTNSVDDGVYGTVIPLQNTYAMNYFDKDLTYTVFCNDRKTRKISLARLLHSVIPYGSAILMDCNARSVIMSLHKKSFILPNRSCDLYSPDATDLLIGFLHYEETKHNSSCLFANPIFVAIDQKQIALRSGQQLSKNKFQKVIVEIDVNDIVSLYTNPIQVTFFSIFFLTHGCLVYVFIRDFIFYRTLLHISSRFSKISIFFFNLRFATRNEFCFCHSVVQHMISL